jgi:hypothetical protein
MGIMKFKTVKPDTRFGPPPPNLPAGIDLTVHIPQTVYILGKIKYFDVFSSVSARTTQFCLMRSNGAVFVFCPSGNLMD